MATYRLSVYVAKRSEGRSATSMAAYRACEVVADTRTGDVHDYTRKGGHLYSEIMVPDNAPDWARDRSELWNRSETAHRKGNAVIAREIQLSLPHELNNGERRELATEFAKYMADCYGVAVDTSLHAPDKEGDNRNYHAHLMLCTRGFDATQETGLSKRTVREFDPIACQNAGRENHVNQWRDTWARMINTALERANVRDGDGVFVTVDHRSYKEREIDLEPQLKEGPAVTAKKRDGIPTDRAQMNDEIKARNAAKMDAEELSRRQAQQITEQGAQELGLKEKKKKPEAPKATIREAQNITALQAERELVVNHENLPPAKRPSESEEKYQARVQRWASYDEEARAKEQPKAEMHYRPKGPSFGR